MFDNDSTLKNRTLFQDYHSLAGFLTRKYKNPTEEEMQEIENAMRNAINFLKLWKTDKEVFGWEKKQDKIDASSYLNKIEEQKKSQEIIQGVPADEEQVV
jgi:hypothetical protein